MRGPTVNCLISRLETLGLRLKLLKRVVNTNDKDIYARYKKVRNAKAQCFNEKLAEVKSAAAYWNLIAEATNPGRRNRIGPLNDFFANIGTRLARASSNYPQHSNRTGSTLSVTYIIVCEDSVQRKLKAIKPDESADPDDIPPRLLKLAEPAMVSPLTCLFSFCA